MEIETETEDPTDTYTPVNAVRIWNKQYPKYKVVIILLVLILMIVVVFLPIGLSLSRGRRRGHVIRHAASSRMYRFSSVQAPTETCREIAVVIQTVYGGGAVDAAVAAAFCAGVTAMDASGLGGSLTAVVYKPPHNGSHVAEAPLSVVAQATTPQLANRLMFYNHPDPSASYQGGLSVAVPGEVSGLYSLWCQFGTLPWADLVAPSVLLLQYYIDTNTTKTWTDSQSTASTKMDGEVPSPQLPMLLQTLLRVSADPASFYNGTLAQDIVADIQDNGGIISAADLAAYTPTIGPAISLHLLDTNLTLHTTPPPSGGGFVNHVMSTLGAYHRNHTVSEDTLDDLYAEMMAAFRAAFSELLRWDSAEHEDLTSIHDDTDRYTEGTKGHEVQDNNTSNGITVIDIHGTCVVITLSLNSRFGSRLVGRRTGILFNNAMSSFTVIKGEDDFDRAWHNHHISPRVMSRSYMAPVLSTDISHQVVLAATGGAAVTAPTGLTQVLHDWLYRNKTLEKAVGLPRMHYNPANGHILFEDGFDWYLSAYIYDNNYPKMDVIPRSAAIDVVHVVRHNTSWSHDWWHRKYIYIISDGRHEASATPDGF